MTEDHDLLFVVVGRVTHPARNPLCSACSVGYPVACVCGGWIHAGETPHGHPILVCSRCGTGPVAATPLVLDGESHAPGRPDCPACFDGRPAPCVCGGLIHLAPIGLRRCDRCGPRCEDLDV